MPQVTAINVYPIKSCGGIARRSAEVLRRGLDGDRRYMLVDSSGVFLTQRRHPRLALVRIEEDDGGYRIDSPGLETLRLPREWPEGPAVDVRVWRDQVEATSLPDEIGGWFAEGVGLPLRGGDTAVHHQRGVPIEAAGVDEEP